MGIVESHSVEPSVNMHHLAEDSCQLQCNLVPIDIVFGQIHKVVYPPALNVFHHENALSRLLDLRYGLE